ncbi:GPR1/FUN34/YaaH family transporter [Pseudonocardia hispaniensis]|uniref:GPR1/FUN34/YaaH family transporter n=1 Tax=Pseudonocardia hispaniensis TaxID=904933 RepID=A0ABW1IWR1_9PSEU
MSVDSDVQAGAHAAAEPEAPAAPPGNPSLVALPTFCVGGTTLGLWLLNYLPVPGGLIPAVFISAGLGVAFGAVWAARIGQSAVAGIFGTFAAFWMSFGLLVMGLVNGWFGLATGEALAGQIQSVQATFLISWLVVFIALTLATLRLPLAFTALFVVVDIAVVLVLSGVLSGSTTLLNAGGLAVLLFTAIGIYLYIGAMSQELGGRALPVGNAVVK